MLKKLRIEKDREFYAALIALAIPLALQSVLTYSVTTLDSIMLGSLGEIPMSAANIANQPFMIVSGIIRGLVLGGSVLIAQYWGKRDIASIKKVIAICMRINVIISLICTAITALIPAQIMRIFSTDTEVILAGATYLRVISFTYALYAISLTYQLACRAMQDARTPLLINLVTYASNIFLNYCFIFGKFGFPKLGITGVAIGTLIARVIEVVCSAGHLTVFNKTLCFQAKDIFAKSKRLTGDLIKYGLPSLLSEMIFSLGMAAYAVIFGRLGTVAMAANTIATMTSRVGEVLVGGVGSAAAVLIGKTIGQGDLKRARLQVSTFNVVTFFTGIVSMLVILVAKDFVLSLYNVAPETSAMASTMTIWTGLFQIAVGFEILYVCGVLVGSGDTNFIFWFTTIIMWCITMPLAFLGAFVFKWDPIVVFIILKSDFLIKGIVGYVRTRGTKWIKEVTVDKSSEKIAAQ